MLECAPAILEDFSVAMDLYWCISTIIFSEDNTIFALTFMGGKINNSVNNGKGISLNGENYHRIGSRFVQLNVFNTENEVKNMINYVSFFLISET